MGRIYNIYLSMTKELKSFDKLTSCRFLDSDDLSNLTFSANNLSMFRYNKRKIIGFKNKSIINRNKPWIKEEYVIRKSCFIVDLHIIADYPQIICCIKDVCQTIAFNQLLTTFK